ncbi:hypothetical protein M441DRAFT_147368 [Trichoderma asperellum CBS 433.97]|uniref:Uncharacterized protein n=1 Tax=Trichoderma asperellum (strain ATCC 204424 / CBS 433.97 / NBRC 101777) TaxID=1042311 RepID=A0A2T3Z0S0_TRIA4|nr:hypothetical protein M441DRAFT_147368 [Trichoderma asperellum CBS 433.97]PTB38419.1 hypothetical protein M441DRAFT_147368 [Trichoderma asperellum CBS 433.97]
MPRSKSSKFLRSSATNPLPVIAPSGTRDIQSKIIALKNERQNLIDTPLLATPEKIRAFHVSLIDAIFSLVGADSSKYQNCFRHCIKLCKATDTYKATSWGSWTGLNSFMKVMEKADRRTRYSNLLHCPAAPDLMVAIAIEKVVLHTQNMQGRNRISDFLRDFDCYNKATSAIYYHQKGNRENILTLDQPWDLTAPVHRPPTRLADKSELTTSSVTSKDRMVVSRGNATRNATGLVENPTSIKIESSPEYEAESSAEHQATAHAIQEAGLRAALQPGPLRGCEGPVPISMPMQEPSTTGEYCVQVSRAETMERLQPLFDRLNHEDWTGRIEDDFMRILTAKSIKVITAEAKGMLRLWASRVRNEVVLSWLEQAQEDLTVFQWIERHTEPPSAMWRSDQSVRAIIHDLDEMIAAVSEPILRDQLWATVSALRGIVAGYS